MSGHLFDLAGPEEGGDPQGEARACRAACALFDFSFVRRLLFEGPEARRLLEAFSGRSLTGLAPGRLRLGLARDRQGRLLSDLTIWSLGEDQYEFMTGRTEDVAVLARDAGPAMRDISGETAILALQGPATPAALEGLLPAGALKRLAFFGFRDSELAGHPCRVARLGFSGEAGVELILPRGARDELWRLLAERARPAGLAAIDILRIEAGLPLFCNDFQPGVTAAEAGLGGFLEADLLEIAEPPPRVRLVSFLAEAGPPARLWRPPPATRLPRNAGEIAVTSACWSPAAGGLLGLGYVLPEVTEGSPVTDPLGAFTGLQVAARPFLPDTALRPRRGWGP